MFVCHSLQRNHCLLIPGTENIAALTPSIIVTSQTAVDRFMPDDRGCYNDDEFDFPILKQASGYRYSMKNCLYEAVIER